MDAANFKRLIKDKFDARTTYDEGDERHPKLAEELIRRAKLQRGWNVLDLACGTGLVTFMAAETVGANGSVTGVDISPGMIKQAEAKLKRSASSNVSFCVGDLEQCDYTKHSFDAILCSSAIFYVDMKSFSKTLHEWLKPGGILAYNTLKEPYTPLLPLMNKLLADRGFAGYSPDRPCSQTHSEEANINILQSADFSDIQVDETVGLLFEKPIALHDYSTKGHELVATAFRPFFPVLDTMATQDQLTLKKEFCAAANSLGQNMLNSAGMVEDKHLDLYSLQYFACKGCVQHKTCTQCNSTAKLVGQALCNKHACWGPRCFKWSSLGEDLAAAPVWLTDITASAMRQTPASCYVQTMFLEDCKCVME